MFNRSRFLILRRVGAFLEWSAVGVKTGFGEMMSHILRSILSAMGVLFGVAVMVAMLSLMGGLNNFLDHRMGAWMGSIFIWEDDDIPEGQAAAWSRSPGLRFRDGLYLEDSVEVVERMYKLISRRERIRVEGKRTYMHFKGLDSAQLEKEFTQDKELVIKRGRKLDAGDFRNGSKVCLISDHMAGDFIRNLRKEGRDESELFTQSIKYKSQRFRIIGVFGPKNETIKRWRGRHNVYIPILAMQKYVTGFNPPPGYLWLQIKDPRKADKQLAQVIGGLLARHRGVEDFEYRKPDHLQEFISMMNNVGNIMALIALVSLLAGGLGIMNVMLSSISERVREIGIRKALGATTVQIFVQFIAETSTLCFLGGIIGAVIGCIPMLFGDAIYAATDNVILPTLLPQYILFVLLILVSMGIIFGLYPALKASRMNPIDALRYE